MKKYLLTAAIILFVIAPIGAKADADISSFCGELTFQTNIFVNQREVSSLTYDYDQFSRCQDKGVSNSIGFTDFGNNPPASVIIRYFPKISLKEFITLSQTDSLDLQISFRAWRKIKKKKRVFAGKEITYLLEKYDEDEESPIITLELPEGLIIIVPGLTRFADEADRLERYIEPILASVIPLSKENMEAINIINEQATKPIIPKKQRNPRTLKQAVDFIYKSLDEQSIETLKEMPPEDFALLHIGFGTYIRNRLGLWTGDAPMVKYFWRKGICHPESMSVPIIQGVIAKAKKQKLPKLKKLTPCN